MGGGRTRIETSLLRDVSVVSSNWNVRTRSSQVLTELGYSVNLFDYVDDFRLGLERREAGA